MGFGDGARHVLPIDITIGPSVDDVMTGAAGVHRDSVEALHAHSLLATWQMRKHGRFRVVVADRWDSNCAVLASGRGSELLRGHAHIGCPVTTSTTSKVFGHIQAP